jgi:hypothetical protein
MNDYNMEAISSYEFLKENVIILGDMHKKGVPFPVYETCGLHLQKDENFVNFPLYRRLQIVEDFLENIEFANRLTFGAVNYPHYEDQVAD